MTKIFIGSIIAILLTAFYLKTSQPESQSEVPILYWVTDPNPIRFEQVDLFYEWLVENNHVNENGKPILELRLDFGGIDNKKMIHGISGVAGDIMDCDTMSFQRLGILADVTEYAEQHNFGLDQTYPALKPVIQRDQKQYSFPCNVNVLSFWSNADTFKKYGMEAPNKNWTVQEFEKMGIEFTKRANKGLDKQEVFFLSPFEGWRLYRLLISLSRSSGQSILNETLTASTLDQGAFSESLKTLYRWTHELHLIPSAAESSSFDVEGGYGGAELSLFIKQKYAMLNIGRWMLIRLREMENPPPVSVSYYPYEKFQNCLISSRNASIYEGSKNKELAALFLAFLASDKYNNNIITTADGGPPNPIYAQGKKYTHPEAWQNEWGAHEVPIEAAHTIAIAEARSPYVSSSIFEKAMSTAYELVMNDLSTPEEAAKEAAKFVDFEIQRNLHDSPSLKERFSEDMKKQTRIDQEKLEDKKPSLELISNPFHKKYHYDK